MTQKTDLLAAFELLCEIPGTTIDVTKKDGLFPAYKKAAKSLLKQGHAISKERDGAHVKFVFGGQS